jgi:hypothetical protein
MLGIFGSIRMLIPILFSIKDKAEETIREESESYRYKGSLRRRDLSTRFDSADLVSNLFQQKIREFS